MLRRLIGTCTPNASITRCHRQAESTMPSVAVAERQARARRGCDRWRSRGRTLSKSILLMRNARSTALTTIRSASTEARPTARGVRDLGVGLLHDRVAYGLASRPPGRERTDGGPTCAS